MSAAAAAAATVVGVDLGAQKTMMVEAREAEIVLTSTGSINRATVVAFNGQERLTGEEAVPLMAGESTVPSLGLLMGRSMAEAQASVEGAFRRVQMDADSEGRLLATVTYAGEVKHIHATALMGMFLAAQAARVEEVHGPDAVLALALPPNYHPSVQRAYDEACRIAGIPAERVFYADAVDCLVAAYARKIGGLAAAERAHLEGRRVLLLDVGHAQTTAVLVLVDTGVVCVGSRHEALGALSFDAQLFEHLAATVKGDKIEPGSKRGYRLLSGCEKLRKLLSQLPEASVTVEHLAEDSDVNLSLSREQLASLCLAQLARLRLMLCSLLEGSETGALAAVEVLGGGSRMQSVQAEVHAVLAAVGAMGARGEALPFGFKLDDSTIALGAALLCMQAREALPLPPSTVPVPADDAGDAQVGEAGEGEAGEFQTEVVGETETVGLSTAEVEAARASELSMQAADEELRSVNSERNRLEAFILEMRSAPGKKLGQSIDSKALNGMLDTAESWLWNSYAGTSGLAEYVQKNETLRTQVVELCKEYFEAVQADKARVEKELEEEAVKGAAERAANGEDEDHDNRKLKKPDRMRLVLKNKEEGTELFKGKNFRPAAARYQKALSHAAKFFDLSKEDEIEVGAVKLSLYLNLASCYIKLENWDQVLRNCDDALAIDVGSIKALFRRASYHEKRKDWDAATADLKRAAVLQEAAGEDKAITVALERIKKEVLKEKAKDKKTWGKMFG
ncbi:Hsp70 protein-domain-containing protein [Ochromonadaceae sp. CCMP2298]|nr:Hsp70 protein-domain-containing protein [Ochromonadaceae sp. CCMP2298]